LAISILSKAFKFLQKTGPISDLKEIISSTEQAMPHIPRERGEDVCQETCLILKYSKPKEEYFKSWREKTLLSLHSDKDVMTLLADQGNATVVMQNVKITRPK
jgi:hypothetical protein